MIQRQIRWWDTSKSALRHLTDGLADMNDASPLSEPEAYGKLARALEAFATAYCESRYGATAQKKRISSEFPQFHGRGRERRFRRFLEVRACKEALSQMS